MSQESLRAELDAGTPVWRALERFAESPRDWAPGVTDALADMLNTVDDFDVAHVLKALSRRAPWEEKAASLALGYVKDGGSSGASVVRQLFEAAERDGGLPKNAHPEVATYCVDLLLRAADDSEEEVESLLLTNAASLLRHGGDDARTRFDELASLFDGAVQAGTEHARLAETHRALAGSAARLFHGRPLPPRVRTKLLSVCDGSHVVPSHLGGETYGIDRGFRWEAAHALAVCHREHAPVVAARLAHDVEAGWLDKASPSDFAAVSVLPDELREAVVERMARRGVGIDALLDPTGQNPPSPGLRAGVLSLARKKKSVFATVCWALVARGDLLVLDAALAMATQKSDKLIGTLADGLKNQWSELSGVVAHRQDGLMALVERAESAKAAAVKKKGKALRKKLPKSWTLSALPDWASRQPSVTAIELPPLREPAPRKRDPEAALATIRDTSKPVWLRASAMDELVPFGTRPEDLSAVARDGFSVLVEAWSREPASWGRRIDHHLERHARASAEVGELLLARAELGDPYEGILASLVRAKAPIVEHADRLGELARTRLTASQTELEALAGPCEATERWDRRVGDTASLVGALAEHLDTRSFEPMLAAWTGEYLARQSSLEALATMAPLSEVAREAVLTIALATPALPAWADTLNGWERENTRRAVATQHARALEVALSAIDVEHLPHEAIAQRIAALASDEYHSFGRWLLDFNIPERIGHLTEPAQTQAREALSAHDTLRARLP